MDYTNYRWKTVLVVVALVSIVYFATNFKIIGNISNLISHTVDNDAGIGVYETEGSALEFGVAQQAFLFEPLSRAPNESCLDLVDHMTDATSAVGRASSINCKKGIVAAACHLAIHGSLHPTRFEPKCLKLMASRLLAGNFVGCYKDAPKEGRLFRADVYTFNKTNSRQTCVDACYRIGHAYAGLQYGQECHCGDYIYSNFTHGDQKTDCGKYICPGNRSETCGGYWWMSVYRTGFDLVVKSSKRAIFIEPHHVADNPRVRILFFLALNGRNFRQFKQTFRLLYRKQHYYYIHVDERQYYLYRNILTLVKGTSNIFMTQNRFSTIWGGASLLKMYLDCFHEIFQHLSHWKWDYIINLSETDMPLHRIEDVTRFLTFYNGSNFVKSHNINGDKFLSKQGLKKTFYECDRHLWRVGNRQLPNGVFMDGGSDWFVLHKSFLNYVVHTNDHLVEGLKDMYRFALLPAESFFHTVLHNSMFCSTYVNSNLKLTNWKKGEGCQCQYNHAVDWCGCSPKVFDTTDMGPQRRLDPEITKAKLQYFARKFDSTINVEVINWLCEKLLGIPPAEASKHMPNRDSVWLNDWSLNDLFPPVSFGKLALFTSLAKLSISPSFASSKNYTCLPCDLTSIQPKDLWYHWNKGQYLGTLISYSAVCGRSNFLNLQTVIKRVSSRKRDDASNVPKTIDPVVNSWWIKDIEVGIKFDAKELLFRDQLGVVESRGDLPPILRIAWNSSIITSPTAAGSASNKPAMKPTNFSVFVYDPEGNISSVSSVVIKFAKLIQSFELQKGKDKPNNITSGRSHRKLTGINSREGGPLTPQPHQYQYVNKTGEYMPNGYVPGIWTLKLVFAANQSVAAETRFIVVPSSVQDLKLLPSSYESHNTGSQHQAFSQLVDGLTASYFYAHDICVSASKPNQQIPISDEIDYHDRLTHCSSDDAWLSKLPLCHSVPWSSEAPDPKSEFSFGK